MSTPEPEVIADQIRAIEAKVHRRGWDKPPELHVLYDLGRGPISATFDRPFPAGSPGEVLEFTAYHLQQPEARPTLRRLRARFGAAYGLVFVAESWMLSSKDPEVVREYETSGKSLADNPHSVEIRIAYGYDMATRGYTLTRVRGQEPLDVEITTPEMRRGGDGFVPTGRVPEALAQILAILTGQAPHIHRAAVRKSH